MLSRFCAFLAFSAVVSGWETTITRAQCQTLLGDVSAYSVPTHTTTITTTAPVVTVAFTTSDTITITPEHLLTIDKTDTSVTTITETVTEKLTGSIFSTTLTRYKYNAFFENYTETVETGISTTATLSIVHRMMAPESFKPINATATTTSESTSVTSAYSGTESAGATALPSGAGGTAQNDKDKMVVYIFKDGVLVPTEIGAIKAGTDSGIVGVAGVGDGPGIKAPTPPADDAVASVTASAATGSAVGSYTEGTSTGPTADTASTVSLTSAQSATEVPTSSDDVHKHTHERRDEAPDERDSRPTKVMGLQGALSVDVASGAVVFPTMVQCTKLFVKEETVWSPSTTDPAYVAATPVTNVMTTLSTLTVTSTVPDRKPFKTASFVTTSSITTTWTYLHTVTTEKTLNYTVSSTTTSYLACATDNFLGPIGTNSTHIVNVYNSGIDKYASYDIGYSQNAEDCCIECHTATGDIPCMGSVFTNGQCLLLVDKTARCYGQTGGAGFFVSRYKEDAERWSRDHRDQRLPEFVLSNGPCGYFYDGGIAW